MHIASSVPVWVLLTDQRLPFSWCSVSLRRAASPVLPKGGRCERSQDLDGGALFPGAMWQKRGICYLQQILLTFTAFFLANISRYPGRHGHLFARPFAPLAVVAIREQVCCRFAAVLAGRAASVDSRLGAQPRHPTEEFSASLMERNFQHQRRTKHGFPLTR